MSELRICRICLDTNVQMHQISGSEVQDVFEKLTNTQVQDDASLNSVCYLCYWQLKKCQQLVIKSQKTEELLKQILLIHTELNLKSIHSVDRLSHGLAYSLKISKTETFQMSGSYEHIKSKDQRTSHTYEVMIKYEPEGDYSEGTHTTEQCREPDEKYNFIQNQAKCIENISESQKNTFAKEHGSSNIVDPLMINKTESLKISECLKNINSEEPRQSNIHDVMIKVEPEDEWSYTTEQWREPDEIQHYIQDKAKPIQNISETENEPLKIVCNKTSMQASVNANKNSFICNDCGKTFDTKALIIKHISKHDCMSMDPEDKCIKNKNYVCKVKFKKGHSLKGHIPMHKGEKSFKCKYCNYTTKTRYILNNHIRTHTGEKPFKCTYCNHTCATRSNLTQHIRTHTREKPFKCQYCSHAYSSSLILKAHIRTHTGEKTFKCLYCNYTCSTNYILKNHIRTHTGEKPFKCEYCDYTSVRSSNLKNHIRTHTGEKPFKCSFCSYTCISSSTLRYHIRTHAGEKPFKCEYCSRTFLTSFHLKRHLKTHTTLL